MTIKVKQKQTIFDVAIVAYQDASRVYDLMADNPNIDGINANLAGLILTYTPATVSNKEAVKTGTSPQKVVTIKATQSLFDVSLQYYGGTEKVYNLLLQNPSIGSIISDPTGISLNYVLNNEFVPLYFRTINKNIATKPLTGTSDADTDYLLRQDGGILLRQDGGYMLRQTA